MYEFEILSIPKTESFRSVQQLGLLAERSVPLSIQRRNGATIKTRQLKIPDAVFEQNTFMVGNNCMVSKLLLKAQMIDSGNLKIRISSLSNQAVELTIDFNIFNSFIEILKDSGQRQKLKSLSKEERADAVCKLLNLSEEKKASCVNRLKEDLQLFFDFQMFGEMQAIDDWITDENIENDLIFIEKKFQAVIEHRKQLPLFEILAKKK